jgi:hypothetical protein
MLAHVDPTLDRPVILFQDVIEILYAADKKGLPEAKLGWFFFPERYRVARAKLMTSLAAFTAGWFPRMRPKRLSIL